jgi:pimeloyl-ACP methyl ester carboxylesterase
MSTASGTRSGWPAGPAGAGLALAVAARSDAVTAVAAFEPVTPRMMDERERAALGGAVARMGDLAAQGRSAEGLRVFAGFLFNDEEIAVAEEAGYFSAAERYVPQLLEFLRQQAQNVGPTHEDPAMLGAISAPVLVLVGSDTKRYAIAYARHVVDHVPNARVREIRGAGHAAPLTKPEALADALTELLAPPQRPGAPGHAVTAADDRQR